MRSIHDMVNEINCQLDLGKAKIFGIAKTLVRNEGEKLPGVIDRAGEVLYVGIDDADPAIIYHKCEGISCSVNPKEARGRSNGPLVNTYRMQLIGFMNRERTNLYADEMVVVIQSQFPETLEVDDYSLIRVFFNSVVLNDTQVYNQEYLSDTNRLGPEHNLFLINYTVEATFLKECFIKCPDYY